jgi:hypothetical protein
MHGIRTRHASWRELLAASSPQSHLVQIFDSDAFLASAVSHFAAEGLRSGDAVVLTGTAEHLRGIGRSLCALGVEQDAVVRSGQLMLTDVHDGVRSFMRDGVADRALFEVGAGDQLARSRADARFCGVRWWGEISNVLNLNGNPEAALAAEDMADALSKRHGVTILCSYQCDRFQAQVYGFLSQVCSKHSHVIPADDYVRHRRAVNRAVADVIGELKGALLQSLVSWRGLTCDLPSSQAVLFWVRDTLPHQFEAILERARLYHAEESAVLR